MANNKDDYRSHGSYKPSAKRRQKLRRCKALNGQNSPKCDKYRKSSNKKKNGNK